LSKERLDQLVVDTRQVAAKVIELKGATVHAPGNAISSIIEAILGDKKSVIPVATPLDGEYGQSNVSIGVPAMIGKDGVEKIIELDLNQQEREWFNKGIESIKSALAGI
jgi:malate dehydrogenase